MKRPRFLGMAATLAVASSLSACGAEASRVQGGTASASKTVATTVRPTTVTLQLTDSIRAEVQEALASGERRTVRLTLKGVKPQGDKSAVEGISVFVNKPDANAATSVKDPHYVGAVSFQPGGSTQPEGFMLDVGPALAELKDAKRLNLDQPLAFTLVPRNSAESAGSPPAIAVEAVQVSVPKKR